METTGKETVKIGTIIKAPIEKVWKAWTDPALILNWFGSDPNGKVLKAKLDVRPGGSFEITFANGDQTEHTCSGIYVDVHEFCKLTFSWTWKSEPGVESFVTLSLTPENSRTLMQFEHALPGIASKHDYLNGWQSTFSKLERMLTNQEKLAYP